MEFKDIVAITGMSGLYKVGAAKSNGVIVTNLEDNKSTFASARTQGITTLDNISVYREHDETIELRLVFAEILKQEKTNPPVDPKKATPEEMKSYFRKIVADFDEERVHQSDMKKIIKWFHILKAHNLIKTAEEIEAEKKAAEEKPVEANAAAEETPKAEKAKAEKPVAEKAVKEKAAKEKPVAEKAEKEKPAKEKAAKKAK